MHGKFLRFAGGGISVRLFHHAYEMPFALHLVRIKAQSYAAYAARYPRNIVYRCGSKGKFGVVLQKVFDIAFVFRAFESAGGVNYSAARTRHARRLVQNFRAPFGTLGAVFLAPLFNGNLAPSEHSLAGAGHVGYHYVERLSPFVRKRPRSFASDYAAFYSAPLYVLRQHFGAGGNYLVAHQQRGIEARRVRALAAGRGAQIQHAFPRLYIRRFGDDHGGRLLDIVRARLVQGRFSGSARVISAGRAPRHFVRAAFGDKVGFNGIYAQRERRRLFVLRHEFFKVHFRKGAHTQFKGFG